MIISKENASTINTKLVYVHDDTLINLCFARIERNLILTLEEKVANKYEIRFKEVLGFEMTACDFWGKSDRVLDFEYIESDSQVLLPRLKRMQRNDSLSQNENLYMDYIEVLFTFVSGDQLRIVCSVIEMFK